jgi:hypothetical protein
VTRGAISRAGLAGLRRRLCMLLLAFAGVLLAATAFAQEKEAPKRDVRFEWDPNRRELSVDLSFRDAIDSDILRKLTRGLPTTIVFTATLYRAGTRNPLSTTAQTCKVTWLVWDEIYLVEITQPPARTRTEHRLTASAVVKRCLDASELFVADSKQIPGATAKPPRDVALYLEAKVQINPVSPELLQRIKRWVSRPSGTSTAAPGDALFSTFTGLFLQRIGNAERELNFTTKNAVPTVRPRPKKQ